MNAVAREVGRITDEATLKGLDFYIIVDRSGSTEKESLRMKGRNRLGEMQEEVMRIASVASRYDSDGITLSAFATDVATWDGITADKVDSVFREIRAGGSTNLARVIRAIQAKAGTSAKNVAAIVFTDGEASDPDETINALADLAKATGGRPKVGIVIVQIGNDPQATTFLKLLDNNLKERGIPDMVATVPVDQSEGLELGQLVWLGFNA